MVYNFPDPDLGLATRQNFRAAVAAMQRVWKALLGERTLCFVKERL
jgi:hypothetical protein